MGGLEASNPWIVFKSSLYLDSVVYGKVEEVDSGAVRGLLASGQQEGQYAELRSSQCELSPSPSFPGVLVTFLMLQQNTMTMVI